MHALKDETFLFSFPADKMPEARDLEEAFRQMKKLTLLSIIGFFTFFLLSAQPKAEIRAVWLTTNYALDWPGTDKDAATQKQKLQSMLDKLQAVNINTIFFQVQCRSDVFWESQYQPWSRHITGIAGKKPDYDVLQFVIDECHARKMEVHAWVVPYPLGSETIANLIGAEHTSVKHPELCVLHDGEWYLDPGLPATTTFLLNLYAELVEKYDFDGINLDYTRYSESNFPDKASYAKYGNGMNKANWRRQNINNFVYALYDMIQTKKPGMKLGAAPIGAYESMSGASSGFTARDHVYQDPVEWMNAGKLDLAAPQVYWNANYKPQLDNWINKSNNRPVVAGLASYRMLASESNWPISTIAKQITTAREINAGGICFFRAQQITDNTKGIYDLLKNDSFKYPANIPPMNWYGATKPNAPQNVNIAHKENDTYTISWNEPSLSNNIPIRYYCVYTGNTTDIDIDDVKNLAAHYVTKNSVELTLPNPSKDYYFTVTAFDKGYYESDISAVVSTRITVEAPKDSVITPVTPVDPVTPVTPITPEVLFKSKNNKVTVKSNIQIQNIHIYATNGKLLETISVEQQQFSLDVSSMEQGVYIIAADLEDGSTVKQKIIKM